MGLRGDLPGDKFLLMLGFIDFHFHFELEPMENNIMSCIGG